MSVNGFWNWLVDASSADKVYIIMHRKADLDSAVSGYVLYKMFTKKFRISNCFLIVPEGFSENTEAFFSGKMMEKLNITDRVECKDKCMMIFVDIGGEETLSSYKTLLNFNYPKVLIDHHVSIEEFHKKFDRLFINPLASSSLEIILRGINEHINITRFFSKREVKLMIYTFIVETRFLQLSNWKTLELISLLMKKVGDEELGYYYKRLFRTPSLSEKIAILKGFQRLKIYRYKDVLMGVTNVSAFQSGLSSKLVSSGIDIAIVYSTKKECKIHIRLSDRIKRKTKLNVVEDIIKVIKREFGGEGGGHAQVGNIVFSHRKCKVNISDILSQIMSILRDKGYDFSEI